MLSYFCHSFLSLDFTIYIMTWSTYRFDPAVGPPAAITSIIKAKFEGAWRNFGEVDEDVQKLWFAEFGVIIYIIS